MASRGPYVQGARVWIPDHAEVWRVAEITRSYKEGDTILHLRLGDGSALAYPIELQLPPLCNPDCLSGANDLVALSHLHEPAVLHSLRRRFLEANAIYTYCGIILIAINPYKPLPIYEEEVIYAYSGRELGDMDPHIFALAEEAYKQMVRFGKNQSLVISGESGAGKTVSAKYAMRFFTTVGGCLCDSSVEEKVLASSPVMEAFGNAKTARNDNSSRFGKYTEIGFIQENVTGATIKTYLLEKSRVTFQVKGERNYHIFYQLCASATLPELQGLGLRGADSFHYTCQGQSSAAQSTRDMDDLESTRHALALLGVPQSEQLELFSILAAILHLGNIVLRGQDRRGDGCVVEVGEDLLPAPETVPKAQLGSALVTRTVPLQPGSKALELFCALLGIEVAQVTCWLCHRKLVTTGETFLKPLSRQQALDSRDALAKHMYGQVFSWIVRRINRALRSLQGHHTSIGILDIYGFEMFELNSFEQFCINYANEKLQQLFNLHIFKLDQEEYVTEGIPWVFVDFCDNQPCLELIEGRLGILDLLNEECKMPQGSDESWAQKLYQTHLSSLHFQKSKRMDAFVVCHFAGKVEYQCDGFVEKNRDTVPEELVGLLRASKFALLAELFLEEGDGPVSRRSGGGRVGRSGRRSLPRTQKSKKCISSQFKASLNRLMEVLGSTSPHYIRCIKPNDRKEPFVFDSRRAVEQLRACGVLETIQISASGYPSRWTYQEFLERYRPLVSREELMGTDMKQICSLALGRLLQDPSKYQFGRTKVFFRAGQVAALEELRYQCVRAACTLLQRHLRGWLARRSFGRARMAVLCLQRYARGLLARRFVRVLRRTRAAVVLQKTLRMVLARRSYLQLRQAAITIQAFARGMFARRLHRQMVWHRKAVVIQAAVRGWLARTHYARLRRAVVLLQCCARRARARRELRRLRIEARSVEHYKQLHKGMEIKVIQLQCRLDEQAQEKQQLVEQLLGLQEQLSGLAAAHAEEVQHLQAELRRLQEDTAQEAQEQHLAELETHSMESCLGREVEEIRQVCWGMILLFWGYTGLSSDLETCGSWSATTVSQGCPGQGSGCTCPCAFPQRLVEVEAVKLQLGEERDALMQRMRDLEEQHQRVAQESQGLLRELQEEREHYRSLEQEYARLEQDYENLRDEVAFHRGLEEHWQTGPEGPQPSDETLLKGQDPLEKVCPLPSEELRTQEELRRSKGPMKLEKNPLQFLKCRNTVEMLGLDRSLEPAPVGEDLKHAYDAVQVANRLLVTQLQKEKQHHEEEVQGLRHDICSLKELSQKQAALIQDLQGQKGLQYHVLPFKEENWELAQKLEKQERTTLKLQKQLRSYAKQMQELAAKREAPGPTQGSAVPAVVPSQSPAVSSLAMLAWRKEDEGRIIKAIITDYKPQSGPGVLPDLPAYILFLCFRHADQCHDEPRALSLLDSVINAIKRVVKKHSSDFDTVALWLSNTCRLQNCLRQYGQDESCWQGNTARQNKHRLRNVDPWSCCRSLGVLAVQLYQQLIRTAEKGLKPMIVAAMLESEPIQGLSSSCSPGHRRSSSAPAHTLPELLQHLHSLRASLDHHGLAPSVGHQLLRQLLFLVSSTTLNYLLLRKDTCSWSCGIQLRYNISQVEQWLRAEGLQQSGAHEVLEPLVQAAQLLQVKKVTEEDAGALCSLCTVLTPQQVVKILRAYTPAVGLEERVSPHFISIVERQLQDQYGEGPGQLLVNTSHLLPVHLPFTASPLHLDELHIPDTLNLPFLVRL
ncbi:Unconventional myosin-Vb [Willisornis vidua]|uniref:Unconventional myosin-Vb n=1 Tax=Willisornis vidua TaxID=1566151 RepID=A0ABQ9D7K1_9PASS|nr:Unconventional myosin-Vb [Willisornis vidua]